MRGLLIFLLGLLAMAGPGRAAPLAAASRRLPPCTLANAASATIEEVAGDPGRWKGRCARLTGIVAGDRLYVDRPALLEKVGMWGEEARRSISVLPVSGEARLPARPARVTAVGRIGSCQTAEDIANALRAAHPGWIVMTSGYCHTSLSLYISATSIHALPEPVYRLVEAEVPAARRELIEPPLGTAELEPRRAAAAAMLDALTRRDEAAFRRLAWPGLEDDLAQPGAEHESWVRDNRSHARRDFAKAAAFAPGLAALAAHQERLFLFRYLAVGADDDEPDFSHFLACWCRSADCAGKWPVLAMDADNAPDRPYFCLDGNDYVLDGRTVLQVEAPTGGRGFAEPRWPAS